MRGQNAILSTLPALIETRPEHKGQRNVHLDRRDDALAARFYYHCHIKRMRYEAALLELETEFFIVPNVIVQRLTLRTDYLKTLSSAKTEVGHLKKLYPFYAWN